jgi:predicted phosphodiesterase
MRIAILSDIHGNSIALDAVLRDIRARGGVDAYWVLGDLAALGPDPVGALERVFALPNLTVTRGNTDRYLVSAERPMPGAEQVTQNPELVARFGQLMQNFAWTIGVLAFSDWLDTLAALPLEQRLVLQDGTRVLGVHAAPGTDDGEGMHPLLTQEQLRVLLSNANADLVFVGHTHWAMDVAVDGKRLVNLGSVSNPFPPDLRAKYTLLDSDARGYRPEHCRVEYDRDAVIRQLTRAHHPAAEYIARYLRGEQKPSWSKNLSAADAQRLGLPAEILW